MPAGFRPFVISDATADDSDKTVTPVPAGSNEQYEILAIYATLVSTATAGNRQIEIEVGDGSVVFASVAAGAVQTATLTRQYSFAPGLANQTAFVGTRLQTAFPSGLVLAAGWTVRVYDSTAVDAAADDLTVRIAVLQM